MNTLVHSNHCLRVVALAAALALTGAAPAHADYPFWSGNRNAGSDAHASAGGSLVDVQVRVDGANAPLYFKQGAWDRHYFQAFRGRHYSLVVRNTTGRRIGVLIAVDGLNVVNGERSRLDRNETMYVLGPWEQADIQGWRTSLNEVRRFVFVDEERSYAERTGQANGDMGWIRVLAFREVEPRAWWPGMKTRRVYRDEESNDTRANELQGGADAPAAPAPEAKLPADGPEKSQSRADGGAIAPQSEAYGKAQREQESAPGTGWGERRYDPVQQTVFEAERWAADRVNLRYEYANGLRALGIFPRGPRVWERERGQLGFAQPPSR